MIKVENKAMQYLFVVFAVIILSSDVSRAQIVNVLQPIGDRRERKLETPPPEQEKRTDIAVTGGASAEIANGPTKGIPQIGVSLWRGNDIWASLLVYAGSRKTITNSGTELGEYLLNPSVSTLSFSGALGKAFSKHSIWGFYIRSLTSFSSFKDSVQNMAEQGQLMGTSVNGFVLYSSIGLQVLSDPISVNEETAFQVGAQVGPAIRAIGGPFNTMEDFRKKVFNVSDTFFIGGELTIFFKMNNLAPYLRLSIFPESKSEKVIHGFSQFEGFIGVDILASVIKAKI